MNITLLFFEIAYYISNLILVIVAVIGLYQLKISKDTRKITSKRAAFQIAAEQCNFYIEKIIPMMNQLDDIIEQKKIDFFSKDNTIIDWNKIKFSPSFNRESTEKLLNHCIPEITSIANMLEIFSLYIISWVASDKIAFNTVGNTFIHSLKTYLPFYLVTSDGWNYKHTMTLFINWNNKIEKEKLVNKKKEIEKKLKGNKTIEINSIWTI